MPAIQPAGRAVGVGGRDSARGRQRPVAQDHIHGVPAGPSRASGCTGFGSSDRSERAAHTAVPSAAKLLNSFRVIGRIKDDVADPEDGQRGSRENRHGERHRSDSVCHGESSVSSRTSCAPTCGDCGEANGCLMHLEGDGQEHDRDHSDEQAESRSHERHSDRANDIDIVAPS